FLGEHIVRRLCERGDEVVVLGRRSYPHLERLGVRCLRGDVRDPAAVIRAVRGADVVFHAAALTGVWGRRRDFQSINVGGTKNILAACRKEGVPRLVFTSSPSVVFGRDDLCGVDESQPSPRRFLAPYPESKAEAERLVLCADGESLATIALRPHLIWGPGDPHLIPRVIERARRGKLKQVGKGTNRVDLTYIDNAVEAHLLAADRLAPGSPCAGKAYFISDGAPVLLWDWINDLLHRLGIPPVRRRVSYRAAYAAGAVLETLHGLFLPQREPPMTRFVASQLSKSHYFNIKAAKRDFSYRPIVTPEDGMERLVRWLKEPEATPEAAGVFRG
ncbi:MAG: NAD-dependent epimerase/dehydratase family protein, partial [Planctomycetota bacterium]